MNEKPQMTQGDEQDLLEQIITQGLDQMNAPTQAASAEEAPAEVTFPTPQRENSAEAASLADRKNRRSSVYLYLLVLFGAAFLLLLLAYFVQQRSSESTISDLRNSMNLSREELLDEINGLKAENDELREVIDLWQNHARRLQEQYDEKNGELTDLENLIYDTQEKVYSWSSFWELERCYQAGDYESCAAILILQGQSQFTYLTPDPAQDRHAEIVQAVIDAGILDENYQRHPEDYDELLDAYLDEHSVDLASIGC